jgi:hypothetical protein
MIPEDFTFSQHSLADFNTCQWRFLLRHVEHVAWPAAEMQDQVAADRRQEQGVAFHLRAMQYFSGLPVDQLIGSSADVELEAWWQDFLSIEQKLPYRVEGGSGWRLMPELQLNARLGRHRVTGKFDLLAALPGDAYQVYDWKSGARAPARDVLEGHPQTRLYNWLVTEAGGHALGLEQGGLDPGLVSMTYWYAGQPGTWIRFDYSAAQFQADAEQLSALLDYIASLPEDGFRKTEDTRACRFCLYRSYCERGYRPGAADAVDETATALELPSWDEIDTLEI